MIFKIVVDDESNLVVLLVPIKICAISEDIKNIIRSCRSAEMLWGRVARYTGQACDLLGEMESIDQKCDWNKCGFGGGGNVHP